MFKFNVMGHNVKKLVLLIKFLCVLNCISTYVNAMTCNELNSDKQQASYDT